MIKKQGEKWLVDVQPGGRGMKRYRKSFNAKVDAVAYERQLQAKVIENPFYKIPKRDTRRLNEIIELWFQTVGILLVTGKEVRQRLLAASNAMGNPSVTLPLAGLFCQYRVERVDRGIKPATLNKELLAFKSVFTSLSLAGCWSLENPFAGVSIIKDQKPKMAYLTVEQINTLLDGLKQSRSDAHLVALVCLSTGARWREAEKLQRSDIAPRLVTFSETKTKKPRSVPITDDLYHRLYAVLSVRSFRDSYSTFSAILKATGIDLPRGQRTHVLRHTFASHFIMNGGNILTLQKVLGHASLDMTLRYSHLAPDYLNEVLEKNPVLTIG